MLSVVCFVLVGVLHVSAQFQSPCPDVFEYKIDGKGVFGLMHIKPKCDAQLLTKVSFTVAARLPSNFVGSIKPLGDYSTNNCDQKTIEYRVNFPLSTPLPRLTMISANDNIICSGPGDEMDIANQYVSTANLEHIIYFKTSSSAEFHQQSVYQTFVTAGQVYEEHAVKNKFNITYDARRPHKFT